MLTVASAPATPPPASWRASPSRLTSLRWCHQVWVPAYYASRVPRGSCYLKQPSYRGLGRQCAPATPASHVPLGGWPECQCLVMMCQLASRDCTVSWCLADFSAAAALEACAYLHAASSPPALPLPLPLGPAPAHRHAVQRAGLAGSRGAVARGCPPQRPHGQPRSPPGQRTGGQRGGRGCPRVQPVGPYAQVPPPLPGAWRA